MLNNISYNILIADYDKQGEIQWKRDLDVMGFPSGSAIDLDEEGYIFTSGNIENQIVQILPNDKLGWKISVPNKLKLTNISLDNDSHLYVAGHLTIRR